MGEGEMVQGEIPIAGTCATCVFWTDGYCGKWAQPTMPGSGCSEGILDPIKWAHQDAHPVFTGDPGPEIAALQARVAADKQRIARLRWVARCVKRLREEMAKGEEGNTWGAWAEVRFALDALLPEDVEG